MASKTGAKKPGPKKGGKKGGRRKGTPKTGGRKKGTPNKVNMEVKERLAALKCDPIEGLATIAMDKDAPIEVRLRANAELAQYVAPKRKAIEISGDLGVNHENRLEHLN